MDINIEIQDVVIEDNDMPNIEVEEEGENDKEEMGNEKNKKPKGKSDIWQFFTRIVGGNPEDPRAACNFCGKDYAAHPKNCGTSTLWNHLNRLCPKNPNRVNKQKTLCFEPKKEGEGGVTTNFITVQFDKQKCRQSIAKYILLEELPFRHVESEGFRQLIRQLEPRLETISRMTIARDIYQLYLDEKEVMRGVMKKVRVSLTTDTWTSIQNINYMCLTAHWIDSDWKLQKTIINFCQITDHNRETIGTEIESCLNQWGIHKIFTITVDNTSTNSTAIEYVLRKFKSKRHAIILDGELLHLRCCAHIVNLIVTDGLKEKNESIAAIRNAVKYVRSSPSRLLAFKECVKAEDIECKGLLCLDVPTRWNSTYLMLECALKFQKAFDRIKTDKNYRYYFTEEDNGKSKEGPPNEDDWENARIFVKFLKTFYEVTLKFSGSSYVTSNLYFQEICEIQNELITLSKSKLIKKIEENLRKLLDFYNEMHFGVGPSSTTSSNLSVFVEGDTTKPGGLVSKFMSKKRQHDGERKRNEIDKYLADDTEDFVVGQRFDILKWWTRQSNRYPVLSLIAQDVLAIPVTTVPSESAFHIEDAKSCSNPSSANTKPSLKEGEPFHDVTLYRSTIGALQYFSLTRLDVAFIVNKLSQFLQAPRTVQWEACKRLFRYLKGTIKEGIYLRLTAATTLTAYSDVD
ncbi:zinc finger BED domain-containing protein RICESLEEPER 4-like [Cannabis sativa]|uniref:zinc finger BED domain-containing protein RICESLEEPER 4-like n=1 Tax=Cannabis sativa TaxID=3483 RepID=UPI0029C9C8D7|nr:zinc finger BED domain-containing protein RICESLEEPER 4-like [Cannabis sativa]